MRLERMFRFEPISILISVVLVASACSSERAGSSAREGEPVEADSEPTFVAGGSEMSRFFDKSVVSNLYEVYWPDYVDFQDLANAADLVFVGRIVGFQRDFATDRPDPEDPSGATIVSDGIDFEVLRIMRGTQPEDSNMVTIAQPVMLDVPGAADLHNRLIKTPPIDVLRAGIENAERGDGPRSYLVFAKSGRLVGGKTAFGFVGPGSVAPVEADNNTIVATGTAPFTDLSALQNGYGVDITVDVVRDWIDNGVPPIEVSLDDRPNPRGGITNG